MKKSFLSKVLAAVFISSMVLSSNVFAQDVTATADKNTSTEAVVSQEQSAKPEKADMDVYEV